MSQQTKTKIIGLIVIVLLTTATTAGAVAYNTGFLQTLTSPNITADTSTPTQTSPATSTATANQTPAAPQQNSVAGLAYKDGTYSADGSFYTPDGTEQIGVKVTVVSDKITALTIDDSGIYSRESVQYTNRFISGINKLVVGKKLSDVNVSRVSGASLTPIGFNNALDTIKNDAKA
jgi:uncharacterized protein with FMN-binding domain